MCAAACTSASGCLGFNWMAMVTTKCQLLSSLRVVVADASCALYVPEVFARTAIKLEFSCPTCMGSAPFAGEFWQHSCDNGVIAGLASVTSFPDLDYMLCIQYQGLLMITNNGFTCLDDTRGCNTITAFPVSTKF
ncbi:uncharacterized protein LOC135196069 [Macrobrachium nipponense]|uniref:uncharacterized protein LOC135196069 n=1 Tax=Macrobrachium nipponense TaxID=159736 RepID=UPI0030C8B72E